MPNYSVWRAGSGSDWPGEMNVVPGFIIQRKAISLVLGRGAVNLAAQTVRLVPADQGQPTTRRGEGDSSSAEADVIVIGDSTFNVQRGDFFMYEGTRYEVVYVDKTMPSKIEAKARARQ